MNKIYLPTVLFFFCVTCLSFYQVKHIVNERRLHRKKEEAEIQTSHRTAALIIRKIKRKFIFSAWKRVVHVLEKQRAWEKHRRKRVKYVVLAKLFSRWCTYVQVWKTAKIEYSKKKEMGKWWSSAVSLYTAVIMWY